MIRAGESYYPVHPGEVLKDEIEYRGISQRELAAFIGISPTVFNEILNAKRPMSEELAFRIEDALGLPAYVFLRMQAKYDMRIARQKHKPISRFIFTPKRVAAL